MNLMSDIVKALCLVLTTYILRWTAAFLYDEYIFTRAVCVAIVVLPGSISVMLYYFVFKRSSKDFTFPVSVIVVSIITVLCAQNMIKTYSAAWGITHEIHFRALHIPYVGFLIATNIDLAIRIVHEKKKNNELSD